jgi:hypothetical protein
MRRSTPFPEAIAPARRPGAAAKFEQPQHFLRGSTIILCATALVLVVAAILS